MSNFELGCLKQTRVGDCSQCNRHTAELLLCPCNTVHYCTQECQRLHWNTHQPDCPYGLDIVETQVCSNCLSTGQGHYSCSCGTTFYCDTKCQRRHWKEHSHVCKSRIRVLLKEAARLRANVGVQCKRHLPKPGGSRRRSSVGPPPSERDGGDGNAGNPLGKMRKVSFDHFENSDLVLERPQAAPNTGGESSDHHHHHHHHQKGEGGAKGANDAEHAFVNSDGEESSSSTSEDMDAVDEEQDRRPKRTASKIVRSFLQKQYKSGDNDIVAESFMVDGEDDVDEKKEGGAATQPPRVKIPVAVYVDMDDVRKKKVHVEGHGAAVTRKIVRLGVIMC